MLSDTILRLPAVTEATGLSRVTVWRYVRAGNFPAPVRLGPNAVGWRTSAVEAWIASREKAAGGAA